MLAALAGCASPGPPLPPSLKLPLVVTDLAATRVGDQVVLHWTTPSRTTDKLLIAGRIDAEICRETAADRTAPAAGKAGARGQTQPAAIVAAAPCAIVGRTQVTSGTSDAEDTLPSALLSSPAQLLAYRVQLLNVAGRTAGPSAVAYAASGPAPGAVEDLRGTVAKAGVVLEWKPQPAPRGTDAVEVNRTTLEAVSVPVSPAAAKGGINLLPGAPRQQAEVRFRAGNSSAAIDATNAGAANPAGAGTDAGGADPGGMIDRTAQPGDTYRYTAQRVRTLALGGQTLALRSATSAAVAVAVRDVFPPDPPTGLIAVPAFAGEGGAGAPATTPAIDLSWEPNMEARIVGYRIYRRDQDAAASWQRLDAEPVRMTAYRDLGVVAGRAYAYRVTAVNEAGNESAPSTEVVETAPAP